MKVYPDKLSADLGKGIKPVYLMHGDNELSIMEAGDQIRKAATAAGYAEREVIFTNRDEDWELVRQSAASLSLFSERRIVDIRLPKGKPGRKGSEIIRELMAAAGDDICFMLTMPRLESGGATSAWFKAIDKVGVTIACWLPAYNELPRWLEGRMRSHGLTAHREALEMLASHIEGNLIAAKREIETLALLYPGQEIGVEQILSLITKSARYPLTGAVDAALQGASVRALNVLSGLREDSVAVPLVLWSFTQDVRAGTRLGQALARGKSPDVAFKQAGVWRNRQPLMRLALSRHSELTWIAMLAKTARIDRLSKGFGDGDVWAELAELCVMLAGDGSQVVNDQRLVAGAID